MHGCVCVCVYPLSRSLIVFAAWDEEVGLLMVGAAECDVDRTRSQTTVKGQIVSIEL